MPLAGTARRVDGGRDDAPQDVVVGIGGIRHDRIGGVVVDEIGDALTGFDGAVGIAVDDEGHAILAGDLDRHRFRRIDPVAGLAQVAEDGVEGHPRVLLSLGDGRADPFALAGADHDLVDGHTDDREDGEGHHRLEKGETASIAAADALSETHGNRSLLL